MTTFDYDYLYCAYTDDTTFFLKDIISIKRMVDTFYFFFVLFKIKTKFNLIGNCGYSSPESSSSGSLCDMRCIDLNIDTLKILGTHFSYKEKLKEE